MLVRARLSDSRPLWVCLVCGSALLIG
uniref:Uncharacterized protein n=1 Tax=Anguilla anguilla TaxID=7936 RepID=A0A0E9S159_ANGAN